MRIVRLFAVVLSILTTGLLLSTPAGAQPPSRLADHITDNTGALTDSDRAAVSAAIDRLYRDRHIQLWVVYVDNYSRFKPENWADQTRGASGMGRNDALLAVATNTKLYSFTAPSLSAGELNSLQSDRIQPAVIAKNWSGAALAAADGLSRSASPAQRNWLPWVIGAGVAVVLLLLVLVIIRARRHRRSVTAGGQMPVDGSLGQALSTADARLRQISDYVAKHRAHIGAEAQGRFEEAKRCLSAAHDKQASNEQEAIAYANRASTLAAQAQTLANSDVLGAPGKRRRTK